MSFPRARAWSLAAIAACFAAAGVAGCTSSVTTDGDGSAGTATGGSLAKAGTSGESFHVAGAGGVPSSGGSAGSAVPSAGSAPVGGSAGTADSGGRGGTSTSGGASSGGAGGSSPSGGAGGAASSCVPGPPLTGGKKYCSNTTGNVGGGYGYELWASGTGSGCMNVYGVDANFSATWTNVEDFLARIGLGFDRTKTHDKIGTISADFAETKTGGEKGLVYVGIYGWTVDPLREYYILDDWGSTKPAGIASDGTPRDNVGTITVDGAVYDVWKKTRTNKPAITGDNKTFDQYFSIRQTARQCGHISVSEHFSKWIGLGLQLGNLVEAKLLLEAQDTSGSIEFTTAAVTVK
ncbi:MAG TPA: glycoside hydrolase family 11 protein [Polyangiaceae bacterium]